MASRSSWTAAGGDAPSCTRAISPATRGSSAARWIAAMVSRSAIGRLPPVMSASGSKPVVSGGTERRSNSSTQPLGTPWWRAVSTRLTRPRTSSTPGREGRKPNMFAAYRSATVQLTGEVLHRHPPTRLRYLRHPRPSLLPCPRRGARVRGRLGARADRRRSTAAGTAGAAGVLRRVHRATAPGGRRAGVLVARSASVGLVRDGGRPAQPRTAGRRRGSRRRLPELRRLRRREGHLHLVFHRGPGTHEGGLVRRTQGDVPRPVP